MKKVFPAFSLGLVDNFGGFMTSIDLLLSISVYCSTEAISSAHFGLRVRSHPRFRFLAGFRFSDVSCCSLDENVFEKKGSKR